MEHVTDIAIVLLLIGAMGGAVWLLGTGMGQAWHNATYSRKPSWGQSNYGTDDPQTIYRLQFRRSMDTQIFKLQMALAFADESSKEFYQKMIEDMEKRRDAEIATWPHHPRKERPDG